MKKEKNNKNKENKLDIIDINTINSDKDNLQEKYIVVLNFYILLNLGNTELKK